MSETRIEIDDERKAFEPGSELAGKVRWRMDKQPRWVELRLFWFTRGKGTEDVGLVQSLRFDQPQLEDQRPFRFTLPPAPYSFSGKLISLVWALELVTEPSSPVARQELVIGPGAREVELGSVGPVPRSLGGITVNIR